MTTQLAHQVEQISGALGADDCGRLEHLYYSAVELSIDRIGGAPGPRSELAVLDERSRRSANACRPRDDCA